MPIEQVPLVSQPGSTGDLPKPAIAAAALRLFVKGFGASEHRLLDATVKISQRRTPPLSLLGEADCQRADVIMIDTQDQAAMQWAAGQHWLKQKAVIWVGASQTPSGHIAVKRPVQWPVLPMLLARALDTMTQAREAANPIAKAPVERQQAAQGRRVLVVDDSLAVRMHLRSLLQNRGIAVTDVESAEAGIEAASATPAFSCILMDVLMPGIDGYEACRRIKSQSKSAGGSPPIIMLTSKSSPFDRIRGKMAGCDAYLTKPVDPERLHEVLSHYLS